MAKRIAIETVDRSLQDITGIQKPFGGKVVVLRGDFMQVLPVVPKATIRETINASLVKSYLYKQMQHMTLTENMKAKSDPVFSDFLLQVGSGIEPTDSEGNIKIPDEMIIKYSKNDEESYEEMLINHIFPNLIENAESTAYMTSRAILTSKNEYVDKLNEKIIQIFPGEDPSEGLCNGTRMVCKEFEDNVIHAEITVGHHAGKHVFIPRIPLSPAENEGYPFQLRRKQFPIRLCFAMTINKAQGQTIPYLPQPVFSHGQLYVALSRGPSMSATKVLIKPNSITNIDDARTKNVVYKEVIRQGP
ncbi:uncharacterized protein LOC142537425 [Primulina tabacum]|uniref:uncharacterized protein LOC142537425 n=1 Tax=Primulina tabacum TaxID=48773 RepID=UPI003F5A86A7